MASVSQFDYINEFNIHARTYLKCKTEASEDILSRTLTIICNSVECVDFNPKNIETSHFFNNLLSIIGTLNVDSPLLWSSILILQKASNLNEDAQHEFVHRFIFVSIIARFLPDVLCKTDKLTKILALLENITDGIKITTEQPYLNDLISVLIKLIMENDKIIGKSSLSVLINLCNNNVPSRMLLKKNTNSTLFHHVKSYGNLPLHLYLLTERNLTDLYDDKQYQHFLLSTFISLESSLENRDVFMLKKTVQFMEKAIGFENIFKSFKETPKIVECIDSLLDKINSVEFKPEINNHSKCVGLALKFLNIILTFGFPFCDIYPKIISLIETWIKIKTSSVDAMDLLRTVCGLVPYKDSENLFNNLEEVITKYVEKSNAKSLELKQTVSFLQLISTIMKSQHLRKLISGVTETFFNEILKSITQMEIVQLQSKIFSNEETISFVICLKTLLDYSKYISSIWEEKLNNLFKLPQVHYIIAHTMLVNDPVLINLIFDLAKTPSFPGLEVSKIISTQASSMILKIEPKTAPVVKCCDFYHKLISEEVELKVNKVLETISKSNISDIPKSELIKIFECKIELCEDEVKLVKQKLELSDKEVHFVNRKLSLLSAENFKYRNMNQSLSTDQEVLNENIKESAIKLDTVCSVMETYKRKMVVERDSFTNITNKLTGKEKELSLLNKQYTQTKTDHINMSKKYKALEKEMADKLTNYTEMKNSLKTSEEDGKLMCSELERFKINLEKSTKQLANLKVESTKNETVIKSLEHEIKEKNKQIKELENELKEGEEMKNMVMNIMKKPKR